MFDVYAITQGMDDLLPRLARQFDNDILLHPKKLARQILTGRDTVAREDITRYRPAISAALTKIGANPNDPVLNQEFMEALLYVESNYNNSPSEMQKTIACTVTGTPLGKQCDEKFKERTLLPMNVHYESWHTLLEKNNISKEDIIKSPEKNILAAALIVKQLDAETDPRIKGDARRAMIASTYGAGQDKIAEVGRPIMYGAKALEIYTTFMMEKSGSAVAHAAQPKEFNARAHPHFPNLSSPASPSR